MRTSPRVLLAWEHGRHFGHRARLGELARQFEDAGAEVVCALPGGEAPIERQHARVGRRHVTSPMLRRSMPLTEVTSNSAGCDKAKHVHSNTAARRYSAPSMAPQSFADVLVQLGLTDLSPLHRAVSDWAELFERQRIDHLVVDTAPTAQLAALLCRIPTVHITNGFDAPPPECPLFGIGLRGPMLEARKHDQLAALNHAFTTVAQHFQARAEVTWRDLLAYPQRWLDVIPETDPYGPRDDTVYLGPIGEAADATPFMWPERVAGQRRVFAYLRDATTARAAIAALQSIGAQALCVWPQAPEADCIAAARTGITVTPHPVRLSDALSTCDAVINYGSPGIVTHALLAGKPQLMIPIDVEKHLVSQRVQAQGLGVMVGWDAGGQVIREGLNRLLDSPDFTAASTWVAGQRALQLARIEDQVEGLLK
jgi:UDP:flavonoid glycosyltransferase YjiC (YdhE family)